MPSKSLLNYQGLFLLALLSIAKPSFAASEMSTLFTTPQERQLINANRYKIDEEKPKPAIVKEESLVEILPEKEVNAEYQISGISLSTDGLHTVWINGQAYLDGARLEDNSFIKVISGEDIKVRITTPDDKQYFATSGETLSVSYMATVGN